MGIEPKVKLISTTQFHGLGLDEYLEDIGSPDWKPDPDVSDAENMVEAAGRMCYRSWQPYDPEKPLCSNPNVTKVREGNDTYLANVLGHKHGSILEHANMTFIAYDVSRVFTHELVRHRAGCAYSQESLRYVRLEDLRFWIPPSLRGSKAGKLMSKVVKYLGKVQGKLAKATGIQRIKSFAKKKGLTSAFRRIAPIGLATSIVFTMNVRALRHVIAMRTAPSAEEEIRIVFNEVAKICKETYPNFFIDMERQEDGSWTFGNEKV